ncbi:choice-of-anchor P family protein [Actinomadura oligospora]|uniref:choice-of-anchor P family protein n=1 Tax=Actinomadura oligospora TaxID=111804 RepID=UPI0004B2ADFC|nr:choice-of-anchor P family protein [Actinomadura oligospora]
MRFGTATARLTRVVALATAGGLLAATPSFAATHGDAAGGAGSAPGAEGSAFGLALTGPIPLDPKPAVASAKGVQRASMLNEERLKVVKAAALDVAASPAKSQARVAKLRVPEIQFAADAVRARCTGGTGTSDLVGATIGGKQLPVAPAPNTTIPVDLPKLGRVALTLNKQERTPTGTRVTAVDLTAPLAHLGPENVRVSSVTCNAAGQTAPGGQAAPGGPGGQGAPGGPGRPESRPGTLPGGKGAPAMKPPSTTGVGDAPRPNPVRHELAVTG